MKLFGRWNGQSEPLGVKWRSSKWFVTLVVGYGIMTDLMTYSVIIPVVPFQLEKLKYGSPSALTGWLLFAYSMALVTFSPFCSWFSEKYKMRRSPMLWGLAALMACLVMFMEAPNYTVMIVARVLQGVSSCVVWVVGLALLADTIPEDRIGVFIGFAMTGLTIGMLAAPPVGGVLYGRFGFRAPFVFGIIVTAIDFVGRLLVIERKDALRWGYDPAEPVRTSDDAEAQHTNENNHDPKHGAGESATEDREAKGNDVVPSNDSGEVPPRKLSELQAWKFMVTSRRTMVALSSIFIYGIVYTGLEPTLALRLQDLYGFNSTKVGLVILASAVAAVFATPICGWISDRYGVEWITVACLLLTIPWYALLIIRGHLALFIVCYALQNFSLSGVVSPLTAELSFIVRNVEGVGFAHVYGFFNVTYGAGSAVGPLAAGLVYSNVKDGWAIMICYGSGILLLCGIANFLFGGERPLGLRFKIRRDNTTTTTQ